MSTDLLETQLTHDLKEAMRAKATVRLEAIRSIRTALTMEKSNVGNRGSLTEAQEVAVLQRLKKQRQESADIYNQQNRSDLATIEEEQLAVIASYLPEMIEGAALEEALKPLLAQVGASGPGDFGKAMGICSKAMAGKAEGKAVAEAVKKLLSGN
ncbi:MAG TPA: glutamyl-tRNA amidotransferase [Cryomorphaceae bacterium]|jgi:uncharacterized protein|nr:glutamyl-tRNA amidotransferase [Cryomorphaceae bacterium]HBJ71069.1 glutamyl-tRNA amidotransferase [Cryomorphaceae bacterium]